MILVDTSVWIEIFRDKTGDIVKAYQKVIGAENYAISRFQQLELLQGASDQNEWELLENYFYLDWSRCNRESHFSLISKTGTGFRGTPLS